MTAKQLQHLAELADNAADFFADNPPQARKFQEAARAARLLATPLEHEELAARLADLKAEIGV